MKIEIQKTADIGTGVSPSLVKIPPALWQVLSPTISLIRLVDFKSDINFCFSKHIS